MYSLKQSRRAKGQAGEPLPEVFRGLTFTRGQLTLVAAAPGVGKSIMALTLALTGGIPTMYFSADSDAHVQRSRAACIQTGGSYEYVSSLETAGELGDIEDQLAELPAWFNYESAPTLDLMGRWLNGYYAVYEEYPELVIVDNASDVVVDTDEDRSESLDSLMGNLHKMARDTGACVVVLHHVTGPNNNGDQPVPLSGVKGQIARVPEQVLTLHRPAETLVNVSVTKNRGGRSDPSGGMIVPLDFDGARVSLTNNPWS